MYDGTREAFIDSIQKVAKACFDAQELFNDINEYIEEDWFIPDEFDRTSLNMAHDIAYESTQQMVDIKWRAAQLQDLLSKCLNKDLRDKQWVIRNHPVPSCSL